MWFVDHLHNQGISVILDWVPAHFCKDEHGLIDFDGTCLYEYGDPLKREHAGWGTRVFDFGRGEVRSFLLSSAAWWLREYHMDGLRVDAVASMLYLDYGRNPGEWTPNIYGTNENLDALEFLKHLNSVIKERNPGLLLVAQENGLWPELTDSVENDHLGFDYKWDMGWMNDTLSYFQAPVSERMEKYHKLTFSMQYFYDEKYLLPFSHDENVHGKATILQKMNGDYESKFPQGRALYLYMYAHPGKKLNFMGGEIGQLREWDEKRQQDWELLSYPNHDAFHHFMMELNKVYAANPAFYEKDYDRDGFRWLDCHQEGRCIYTFERRSKDQRLLAVFNFSDQKQEHYQVAVPGAKTIKPLLSTDWKIYGGGKAVSKRRKKVAKGVAEFTLAPFSGEIYVIEE